MNTMEGNCHSSWQLEQIVPEPSFFSLPLSFLLELSHARSHVWHTEPTLDLHHGYPHHCNYDGAHL
jgi:hypothetical protein